MQQVCMCPGHGHYRQSVLLAESAAVVRVLARKNHLRNGVSRELSLYRRVKSRVEHFGPARPRVLRQVRRLKPHLGSEVIGAPIEGLVPE